MVSSSEMSTCGNLYFTPRKEENQFLNTEVLSGKSADHAPRGRYKKVPLTNSAAVTVITFRYSDACGVRSCVLILKFTQTFLNVSDPF